MKTNTGKTAITAAQSQLDDALTKVDAAAAAIAAYRPAVGQNPAMYGELVRRYTTATWKLNKITNEGHRVCV